MVFGYRNGLWWLSNSSLSRMFTLHWPSDNQNDFFLSLPDNWVKARDYQTIQLVSYCYGPSDYLHCTALAHYSDLTCLLFRISDFITKHFHQQRRRSIPPKILWLSLQRFQASLKDCGTFCEWIHLQLEKSSAGKSLCYYVQTGNLNTWDRVEGYIGRLISKKGRVVVVMANFVDTYDTYEFLSHGTFVNTKYHWWPHTRKVVGNQSPTV